MEVRERFRDPLASRIPLLEIQVRTLDAQFNPCPHLRMTGKSSAQSMVVRRWMFRGDVSRTWFLPHMRVPGLVDVSCIVQQDARRSPLQLEAATVHSCSAARFSRHTPNDATLLTPSVGRMYCD